MSVAVANNLLEAVEHLAPGMTLRVDDVSWKEYEQLLTDLGESYHKRIFYDCGRLEVMTTTSLHERPKNVINRLMSALSDELDVDIESCGSTTYKEEIKAKGAEPDDSFYIQNASNIIGQTVDLDLAYDPPPDLVVEIDRTSSSLNKFSIYAGLGVGEFWRVRDHQVRIWLLDGDEYEESTHSRAFPFLTADALSEFVEKGITVGSKQAAKEFREWIRQHKTS